MSRRKLSAALALCAAAIVAASVAAYTATATPAKTTASQVVLGFTNTGTGALAPLGTAAAIGVKEAVAQVNAAGGVTVGGKKVKVKLAVLDNKSNPGAAASTTRDLFLKSKAVAVVSAWTPDINIPASNVAEQLHRPVITIANPVQAWLGANKSGWKWAWDMFFDELQFTQLQYKTANLVPTNRKVVLFTDTEIDGVVMGDLWQKWAAKYNYTVVARETFAPGTTDFSTYIKDAQSKDAQILIAQMIPPDGVALWKQMKALGYVPKMAFCEKCASPGFWEFALGPIAEGTLVNDGGWSSGPNYPQTQYFLNKYLKKLGWPDTSMVVQSYAAARVVLDAISRAGSTSPAAINAAIAKTNKLYVNGHVKFDKQHVYRTVSTMLQIQSGQRVEVWPKKVAPIATPPAGLK